MALLGSAPTAEGSFPGRDGRITFVRDSRVYVMKPNGTDVRRLTRGAGEGGLWPAFAPNGRTIVFSRLEGIGAGPQDLAVMNARGRNLRVLTTNGRTQEPAFAPSGRQIAFAADEHIHSIAVDGGAASQLTDDEGSDASPTYSPRANRIAFVRRFHNPGFARIWVMRRDGTQERALTGMGGYSDAEPSYSPDGRRIAFIRYGQVWVMRADGTRQKKLTRFDLHPFQELSSPAFSPTGRRIAFVGPGRRGHAQVWVMKANGTRIHAITNSRERNSRMADWGPGH